MSITLEEKSTIEEVFWVYVQRLKNQVQQMDFSYLSAKEVHDIRTEIRVIRALIWLMTDKEEDTQLVKDLQIQDIQLKKNSLSYLNTQGNCRFYEKALRKQE